MKRRRCFFSNSIAFTKSMAGQHEDPSICRLHAENRNSIWLVYLLLIQNAAFDGADLLTHSEKLSLPIRFLCKYDDPLAFQTHALLSRVILHMLNLTS